jgi:hypothetical protein
MSNPAAQVEAHHKEFIIKIYTSKLYPACSENYIR